MRNLLREERRALERHARLGGCRLIIEPTARIYTPGVAAREVRLVTLLDFLKSMPPDRIEVALSVKAQDTNLVIIGDYFSAESMVPRPGMGYLQTIFLSHPPTVLQKIRQFDQLFNELKEQQDTSVAAAIQRIETIIESLHSTAT